MCGTVFKGCGTKKVGNSWPKWTGQVGWWRYESCWPGWAWRQHMQATPLWSCLEWASCFEISFDAIRLVLTCFLCSSFAFRLCPERQLSIEMASVAWVSVEVINVAWHLSDGRMACSFQDFSFQQDQVIDIRVHLSIIYLLCSDTNNIVSPVSSFSVSVWLLYTPQLTHCV